jgi:mannan endo-1,4-beta-mannosidase
VKISKRILLHGAGLAAAAVIAVTAGMHYAGQKVEAPLGAHAGRPGMLSYLGVYEPSSPHSYAGVAAFTQLVGYRPQIAVYYSGWWEPFQTAFADEADEHQATPMVQIEPRGVSIAAIAAGQYDAYLIAYARAVRSFGKPVILSFGHEMNADWYGWGYRHTPAAEFVAAWRHIHNLFAAQGADNVTWLWTVNVVGGPQVTAIKAWWPGAAYVTWAGIDGHYFDPSVRFPELFGATLGQIRALTRDPVLVAEAGIAPYVSIERITDLFAGATAHNVIGVVWFDVKGHNLRLEGDPAAIATFRRAISRYLRPQDNAHP